MCPNSEYPFNKGYIFSSWGDILKGCKYMLAQLAGYVKIWLDYAKQ